MTVPHQNSHWSHEKLNEAPSSAACPLRQTFPYGTLLVQYGTTLFIYISTGKRWEGHELLTMVTMETVQAKQKLLDLLLGFGFNGSPQEHQKVFYVCDWSKTTSPTPPLMYWWLSDGPFCKFLLMFPWVSSQTTLWLWSAVSSYVILSLKRKKSLCLSVPGFKMALVTSTVGTWSKFVQFSHQSDPSRYWSVRP